MTITAPGTAAISGTVIFISQNNKKGTLRRYYEAAVNA
jgi:hypothetical protein